MITENVIKLIGQLCARQEPFWHELRENYIQLTEVAYASGILIEGNIYNYHHSPKSYNPTTDFLAKRHSYALFAAANKNVVEIGFNAGHSALLALTVNPELHYTAIDIGRHAYTVPCFEFLKEKFGDRIDLIIGDSRIFLPTLFHQKPQLKDKIDGWIIDGDHTTEGASADIENVLSLSKNGDRLLFDDTDMTHLDWLLKYYQMAGKITPIADLTSAKGSLVFSINK